LNFDGADEAPAGVGPAACAVLKTSCRTVVSLELGCFRARETVHHQEGKPVHRSTQLASLAPRGARYGFDLIAHVGVESFLRGHSLQEIRKDLASRPKPVEIPLSTLWDQQRKFLFYLGHLHRQAADPIRQYLGGQGETTWLLDGTLEPGTQVFLGIEDAASGLFLGGWKVASENIKDIASCLNETAGRYGKPARVLHDLSAAMSGACDQALRDVPHFVCHYHLCRDVGEDLLDRPQSALNQRLRSLKLQARLKEQRDTQTEWLRRKTDPQAELVLSELLNDRVVPAPFSPMLGREVLLALHYWILDYRCDGRRRGFPFDPYTLYLHRRLVRASNAVDRLMSNDSLARQAPRALVNFQKLLREYRSDAQITAAAESYERAFTMFDRLRQALRLTPEDMDHLRQLHELPGAEQSELKTALDRLRQELRQQSKDGRDADQGLARIVLTHLDKYWTYLMPDAPPADGACLERTTNQLERRWGDLKRARRRGHGRGKLVRDFVSLPEEYLLISNLENPVWVDLVLGGNLQSLPGRLADASREAGSFAAWNASRRPCPVGQLPRRLLRNDNFIDHLIQACHEHCDAEPEDAA
jgi:tetratricopeptide (TPR) repeat protein